MSESSLKQRILFVDDEPQVTEGLQRALRSRRHEWQMQFVNSGAEGLQALASAPCDVIVSDMQMPGMNGIDFLSRAAELAPHTVRMMLTGNADQGTASAAVNEGRIFRFLNKPCTPEALTSALQAGLAQYKLVMAEKELLEKTLIGSIGILVDVLSISDPQMFARGKKLRDCVRETSAALDYRNRWELEVASLLSQIGSLTLPSEILLKERAHIPLTPEEREVLERAPESGCNLLVKIPRLETVAHIIRYQHKNYNGTGLPPDAVSGEAIPFGARILKVLADMLDLEAEDMPRSVAFRLMCSRHGCYDPAILETLNGTYQPVLPTSNPKPPQQPTPAGKTSRGKVTPGKNEEAIHFAQLVVGDVLVSDLETTDGARLLQSGSAITQAILEKLTNYARLKGVREPFFVAVQK